MNDIKTIAASKIYEQLVIEADPMYEDVVKVISIVKNFIRTKKLIIYGGTAIDFALRLRGDKIYPDESLSVADLDFFSPDSVNDSYELADILYAAGYAESRAIVATYVRTMRVDIGSNHFIADISYMPPRIFEKMPYLEYDGMRIVHPNFQRADLHSSLSFPYDNPPQEVIFSRWSKDIKRFNLLDKYYPIKSEGSDKPIPVLDFAEKKSIYCGDVAYSILYTYFIEHFNNEIDDLYVGVFKYGANITASCRRVEVVNFNIDRAAAELGLENITRFAPYINLLPKTLTGVVGDVKYSILSTQGKLLAINTIKLKCGEFRIANVQFQLKYFIGKYLFYNDRIALEMYISILKMIAAAETRGSLMNSPLMLSINTYGNENRSSSSEVAVTRLLQNLGEAEQLNIPRNYNAAKKVKNDFIYDESEFFIEDGRSL